MSRRKDQFEVDGGWIGAAIVTVFCPPVGLIMLFNKLRKSHATSGDARQLRRIGTSLLAAGVGLTAFGAKGGVFWLAAGGALLGGTRLLKKREQRYYQYLAVLSGRNAMFLANLATTLDLTVEQVTRDLKRMLEKGWFRSEAYLDMQSGRIVLCREGATDFSGFAEAQRNEKEHKVRHEKVDTSDPKNVEEAVRNAGAYFADFFRPIAKDGQVTASEAQSAQPEPQPAQSAQAKDTKESAKADAPLFESEEYDKIIREIRELNDRIADKVISDKIDRIELLTTRIFHLVEERPAMKPQIRKFMNYYLPTTLKLLDSYALLEAQGIEGDNITASKKEIERTMDTLIAGFEKQLDRLFSSQAMDITADVEVLEGMMAQDGLGDNKYTMKTGGH